MFRKLRTRTAIYELTVIGIVLLIVFACSCVYNYERMSSGIDRKLSALEQTGSDFTTDSPNLDRVEGRNTLIIRVYFNGKYKMSSRNFYDEETVIRIITEATNGKGRTEIGGNNIAYSVVNNGGDYFYTVYIYDYSGDLKSFWVNLITLVITALAVMIVVTFFITRFTSRNLAPIEGAVNKQKELVANASHELKTPLTIINTNLSILMSSADEFTDEQKKWLSGIGTQVNRMGAMVNEMLVLAKLEASRSKDFERVDFSTVVETVVLETEALAFEKQIVMDADIARGIEVNARHDDLEKLTYILVENALKYTKENGVITVKLAQERHKTVLKVRNTGEGIPREIMPKLFDRFYRADEAHTDSGSFGLGLSIAKAIVDACGGTIGVDSKQGEYTEFIVIF